MLTTGCVVNRATGRVDPSANLPAPKTMYVNTVAEDDNTYKLIAEKLRTKGTTVFNNTTGGCGLQFVGVTCTGTNVVRVAANT